MRGRSRSDSDPATAHRTVPFALVFVRCILVVFGLALAVSPPAAAQGNAEPDEDEVCILAPQDGTTFEGASAAIDVDIEATHGSNLVIEEVGLRVDGVDFEGTCPWPGVCSFQVELEEGEHELRAYASRNLGPELVSNLVTVTVVPEGGTSSTTDASTSGDSSTSGSSSGGMAASTGDEAEPGGDEGGREPEGCSCTHRGGAGGSSAMATLVVLLVAGRGRRKSSAN
jgi:MYXO-CTERM domain-containing protein